MKIRDMVHKDANTEARSSLLISSLRVSEGFAHWRIDVFSRGGRSGELVVNAADGAEMCERLLPSGLRLEP